MTFLLIVSGSVLLLYMAIILFASYKIKKPFIQRGDKIYSNNTFSIIIPFRDEIENLKHIYSDLLDLKFDQSRIEIIFIDDHSTDGSFEWFEKCDLPVNYKLLKSLKVGKKQALIKAISLATGNYIITTDADCRLNPSWIKSIDETIDSLGPKLLIQPVITRFNKKLVCQFQYFDSLSLLGINMAVYNFRKYVSLASGANLVFQKKAYDIIKPFQDNVHIASGDDMFVLKSFIKHYPDSITLNYTLENLVVTKSENNWVKLIYQRMRWVGKMKRFNDSTSYFLGFLSIIVQIILIEFIIISAWFQNYYVLLIVFIWLVKSLVDYLFFKRIAQYFDQKVRWFNVFILEPVYMVFVPLVIVLSLFDSPKWKGRKIIE